MMKKALLLIASTALLGLGSLLAQDQLSEQQALGKEVFSTAGGVGCKTCHGNYALGDVQIGPNIRGLDEVRIRGALDAVEEMDFLNGLLSPDDIANAAAYLGYLDTLEPVSLTLRQAAFTPTEATAPSESRVQLILTNNDRAPCTLTLEGIDVEPLVIEGRGFGDIVFDSPAEGTLAAYCQETPDNRVQITLEAPAE